MANQHVHPDEENYPSTPPATISGQYVVVRFPKHLIFSTPPPGNALRYEALVRSQNRRNSCHQWCCCLLLLLIIATSISVGALHLIFRSKHPRYAITNMTTTGMNLTSSATVSPGFAISFGVENPNRKVGILYLKHSSVRAFYEGLQLSSGSLPEFFQPHTNVTVVKTLLRGSDVVLGRFDRIALSSAQSKGRVPLTVSIRSPVRMRVGAFTMWKITFRVRCDVVLDGFNQTRKIVSNKCVTI